MFADEATFSQVMTRQIEPYLRSRCTQTDLEREAGHRIYCEYYDCDRPGGIAVLVHGYTETANKFHEVIFQFLQWGYHVCILDQCGHGRSYRLVEGDLSLVHVDRYTRYVDDLEYVAQSAARRWPGLPLVLYAHSMGGGVGAALAGRSPDLFARVILTSPMIRPTTAGVPWVLTQGIARVMCLLGKSKSYVMGQHPYDGKETFEGSASTSRARYEYYLAQRKDNPLFQMSGASYGWLREAGRLNRFLMHKAFRTLSAPLLLIQAETEDFVSKAEQERFLEKLRGGRADPEHVRLVRISNTKHEIYNATREVLEVYFREIQAFLEKG